MPVISAFPIGRLPLLSYPQSMNTRLPILCAILLLGLSVAPFQFVLAMSKNSNAPKISKPKSAMDYCRLACAFRESQDYDAAIAMINKSIDGDSKSAVYYTIRGELRQSRGDPRGALRDYDRAIELKPATGTYLDRAQAREQIGEYHGAIADYKEYLKEPDQKLHQYILTTIARLQINTGDCDGAIGTYSQLIAIEPTDQRLFERGHLLLVKGQLHPALADLNKALRDKYHFYYPPAFRDRAQIRLKLGDYLGAAEDYWVSDGDPSAQQFTRWLHQRFGI